MAIQQQLEGANRIQYISPKGDFETFRDDNHFKEKLKEWGLSAAKTEFWFKDRSNQLLVCIKGYESYGSEGQFNTVVLEFPDGNLSCIHPAYLKEMQQGSFSKESKTAAAAEGAAKTETDHGEDITAMGALEPENVIEQDYLLPDADEKQPKKPVSKPKTEKPKAAKKEKLVLPEEKVHFMAKLKQIALTYNPFNEENDEVLVLEEVQIAQEPVLDLEFAWCSYSKTLKKLELNPGDSLEFDAKVVAKKLAKGKDVEEEFLVDFPVLYKINNPSKIVKK